MHPDEVDNAAIAWRHSGRTRAAFQLDLRIRRSDGTYRWHAFRCVPVRGADDVLLKWIGTATDIDHSKAVETDLRHAERQATETLPLLEVLQSKAPVGFGSSIATSECCT